VVRESDSQCISHNCSGFYPSILRQSGISGAADQTVLNTVHKNPPKISCDRPLKLPVDEEDDPWYRRVFVYSPVVEFSKAEGELLERGTLTVDSR
jgi:hypothetical protein